MIMMLTIVVSILTSLIRTSRIIMPITILITLDVFLNRILAASGREPLCPKLQAPCPSRGQRGPSRRERAERSKLAWYRWWRRWRGILGYSHPEVDIWILYIGNILW